MEEDRMKQRGTQLYRHFDKDGVLLYVGISLSAIQRLEQHKTDSGWFKDIATITVQHFRSRADALWAETQAIHSENPKYNIVRTRPQVHTCDEPTSTERVMARIPVEPGPFTLKRVAEVLNTKRAVVLELARLGSLKRLEGIEPIRVSKDQLIEYVNHFNMDPHA